MGWGVLLLGLAGRNVARGGVLTLAAMLGRGTPKK